MAPFNIADIFIGLQAKDVNVKQTVEETKNSVNGMLKGIGEGINIALGSRIVAGVETVVKSIAGIGSAVFSASSDFSEATARMQGQLGLTDAGAQQFGNTMKAVFANNFGNDIDDVADSLTKVISNFNLIEAQLENADENVIQRSTEKAIAIRDAFEADVNQTSAAVAQLVKNFGITTDQAFDLIASGFQNGLDANGDWLDTIGEYSTQFGSAGASAEQFFGIVRSGMSGAALGTDKAADAFKEFRVRIQDGSELTKQGLETVGIDVAKIQKGLADGTITAADAFFMAQEGLRGMTDKTAQFQAGVALFGTQFEDLGTEAFLALSASSTTLDQMTGAIDKVNKQYNTLPQFFEGIRRSSLVALTPITDTLLEMANAAIPSIQTAFNAAKPAIDAFAAGAREQLEGLLVAMQNFIANSAFEWSPTFKRIKLGDLFEFVQVSSVDGSNVIGSINIADWFIAEWDNKFTKLTFGDLFDFVTTESSDTINIGDFFTFEVDKSGWTKKLTLGDFFTFIRGDEITTLNIGKYVQFVYRQEDGKFNLNIPGLLGLTNDSAGVKVLNISDYVKLVYKPEQGVTRINFFDIFQLSTGAEGEKTINVADYVELEFRTENPVILRIGDFFSWEGVGLPKINLAESLTFDITEGGLLDQARKLKIWDFLDWGSGSGTGGTGEGAAESGEPEPFNIADLFTFHKTAFATRITLGDVFEFLSTGDMPGDTSVINIGKWFTLTLDGTDIKKLTIGDLIDFDAEKFRADVDSFMENLPDFGERLKESFTLKGVLINIGELIDFTLPGDFEQNFRELTELELPDFKPEVKAVIANLILFKWPEFAVSVVDLLTAIISWVWPEFGEAVKSVISKITDWTWPEFGTTVTGWISKITDWTWPDFGQGVKDVINSILGFQWPVISMPAWVQDLLNFVNGGSTAPAGAAQGATTLPQGTTSGVDPNSPLGQASQGAAMTTPVPEVVNKSRFPLNSGNSNVTVGQVVVNNNVDAERLIWDLGQRLTYGI